MHKLLRLVAAMIAIILVSGCTGPEDQTSGGEAGATDIQPFPEKYAEELPGPVIPTLHVDQPPEGSVVTPAPADSTGPAARIAMDRDVIPVNEMISFRIVNEGSRDLLFRCGDPYHIERQEKRGWVQITGAGGTQAFWSLKPGETSPTYSWSTAQPHWAAWYENVTTGEHYKFSPGRYRIIVEAIVPGKTPAQNVPVTLAKEFGIREGS